jgi:hypothetical protein
VPSLLSLLVLDGEIAMPDGISMPDAHTHM